MASETFTANIEVKDLPRDSNNIINALAKVTGKPKWQHVRQALIEYANNHKADVAKILGIR